MYARAPRITAREYVRMSSAGVVTRAETTWPRQRRRLPALSILELAANYSLVSRSNNVKTRRMMTHATTQTGAESIDTAVGPRT